MQLLCLDCIETDIHQEAEVLKDGASLCIPCLNVRKWVARLQCATAFRDMGEEDYKRFKGPSDISDRAVQFAVRESNGLPLPELMY